MGVLDRRRPRSRPEQFGGEWIGCFPGVFLFVGEMGAARGGSGGRRLRQRSLGILATWIRLRVHHLVEAGGEDIDY